ncbi:hypothetical protein [Parafrankia elaeagni]|uniref:hypothetical protein n=1 Tax=Parafrankia elaeagni TaxID=222534 RepID=UPI0003705379|nr:hypothetical protein [Parafrankia elaeagni]
MGEFLGAALGFPAALFSFALLVVVGYWVAVLFGGISADVLDVHGDLHGDIEAAGQGSVEGGGFAGFLAAAGLGGVPVTVAFSVLLALAWFASIGGGILLDHTGPGASLRVVLSVVVLPAALLVAWLGTRLLILPLRRIFAAGVPPSRVDFVGSTCVIRTGRVGPDFGQAEVVASDGSSALIQVRHPGVRHPGVGPMRAGSSAVIYAYDAEGEFFWVAPLDATWELGRGDSATL